MHKTSLQWKFKKKKIKSTSVQWIKPVYNAYSKKKKIKSTSVQCITPVYSTSVKYTKPVYNLQRVYSTENWLIKLVQECRKWFLKLLSEPKSTKIRFNDTHLKTVTDCNSSKRWDFQWQRDQ